MGKIKITSEQQARLRFLLGHLSGTSVLIYILEEGARNGGHVDTALRSANNLLDEINANIDEMFEVEGE